jgi:hypothetical protein
LDNILTIGESARVKKELAGLALTQEISQKELQGGGRYFMSANFVEAMRRRYDCCEKCEKIAGSHINKN